MFWAWLSDMLVVRVKITLRRAQTSFMHKNLNFILLLYFWGHWENKNLEKLPLIKMVFNNHMSLRYFSTRKMCRNASDKVIFNKETEYFSCR